MDVKPITPEQALEYDDKINTYKLDQEISNFDAKFIEMFHKCDGNGTEAYLQALSPKKVKRESARVYASRLMKKYNLRAKRADARNKVKVHDIKTTPTKAEDVVRYVKKQLAAGVINEEEIWEKMSELARYSTSEAVQKAATETMYAWTKEAKSQLAATALAEQDVVSLCIDAISSLPKEKYLGVLAGIRHRRHELIVRRTETIDADKIREDERRKAGL